MTRAFDNAETKRNHGGEGWLERRGERVRLGVGRGRGQDQEARIKGQMVEQVDHPSPGDGRERRGMRRMGTCFALSTRKSSLQMPSIVHEGASALAVSATGLGCV